MGWTVVGWPGHVPDPGPPSPPPLQLPPTTPPVVGSRVGQHTPPALTDTGTHRPPLTPRHGGRWGWVGRSWSWIGRWVRELVVDRKVGGVGPTTTRGELDQVLATTGWGRTSRAFRQLSRDSASETRELLSAVNRFGYSLEPNTSRGFHSGTQVVGTHPPSPSRGLCQHHGAHRRQARYRLSRPGSVGQ